MPLETERGYNVSFPGVTAILTRPVSFQGHGFVTTPLDTGLRIGGAVELAGLKLPPNHERSRALHTKATRFVPRPARPMRFRDAIGRIIGARSFADLKVPLTVTAVDVDKLELVVFGHGGIDAPLLDVLAATCALPPYFPAVSLGGRMLRDGGLMGHLPLSVVGETGGQPVIAVDAGPGIRQRA